MQQEHTRLERRDHLVKLGSTGTSFAYLDPLQPVKQALFVSVSLHPADEPGPCIRQRFVIEIHGVLRGENQAQSKSPSLLEQGEYGLLGGRIPWMGRQIPKHLIHVHQRPQAGRAALSAHPAHDLLQQQRNKELLLRIRQVSDIEHAHLRFSCWAEQQPIYLHGLTLDPVGKRGGSHQPIQEHRQPHAILLRIEGIDRENAKLRHRWLLHAEDQLGQIQILSRAPGMLKDVGQQDMLPAADRVGLDINQS